MLEPTWVRTPGSWSCDLSHGAIWSVWQNSDDAGSARPRKCLKRTRASPIFGLKSGDKTIVHVKTSTYLAWVPCLCRWHMHSIGPHTVWEAVPYPVLCCRRVFIPNLAQCQWSLSISFNTTRRTVELLCSLSCLVCFVWVCQSCMYACVIVICQAGVYMSLLPCVCVLVLLWCEDATLSCTLNSGYKPAENHLSQVKGSRE